MSGTTTGRAGGATPDTARRAGRGTPRGPVLAVIVIASAAAMALRLYQLARPGYLLGVTQYDDGPYFGSAVRLVHGVLPYRDFVMVQPPGITLLMTPAALLSDVTGTAWGMAVGRILTSLASVASVALAGLLIRHRGLLAVTVTCVIMAIFPANLVAAHTVLVEPWLVLFTLTGAVAVFGGDRLTASGRRLAWGGAAVGFAGATEAWAIFPLVVLLALALPGSPGFPRFRRALLIGGGAAAGFCLPVLPFAALAPQGIYQSLVTSQIGRVVRSPTSLGHRLRLMTGIGQVLGMGRAEVIATAIAIVAFVAVASVAASLIGRRPPPPLECFAIGTAVPVTIAFLWYPQFFLHFPAFLAPFLALSIALPASRLLSAARDALHLRSPGRAWRWTAVAGAAAVTAACAAGQTGSVGIARARVSAATIAAVRRIIPPGACVATDQVSYLLAANRFTSDIPGCSVMVDGLATDYALSHGRDGRTGGGRVPAVAAAWRREFSHAGYAWLSARFSQRRIAWNPALRDYFRRSFVPVLRDHGKTGDVVYRRKH